MNLQIRPYHEPDESAVVELWSKCGLVRPWNDPRRDIARKLDVQRELFLVAVAGQRVIGSVMAGYEGHRGWINYLAVEPDHRRSGVGRALMAEAERRLRALGCPKINRSPHLLRERGALAQAVTPTLRVKRLDEGG